MSIKSELPQILEHLRCLGDEDADIPSTIQALTVLVPKPQILKDMLSVRYGTDKMLEMVDYMSESYLAQPSDVCISTTRYRQGINL